MSGVGRIVFSPPFLFLSPAVGSQTCWRWTVLACSQGCRHWAESHQNSGSGHAPGDYGPSRLPLPRSRAVGQPLLGRKCFGQPSDSCTLPSRAPGVVSVSGGRMCDFPGAGVCLLVTSRSRCPCFLQELPSPDARSSVDPPTAPSTGVSSGPRPGWSQHPDPWPRDGALSWMSRENPVFLLGNHGGQVAWPTRKEKQRQATRETPQWVRRPRGQGWPSLFWWHLQLSTLALGFPRVVTGGTWVCQP